MDTIIYLVMEKNNHTGGENSAPPVFSIREREGAYRLLRVGIPEHFFEKREPANREAVLPEGRIREAGARVRLPDKLWRLFRRRPVSGALPDVSVQEADGTSEKASVPAASVDWAGELYGYLTPFLEGAADYTVFDEKIERWMKREGLSGWWEAHWPVPSRPDFHELVYVEELLARCHLPDFLIFGRSRCLPELLLRHVRYMKSLRLMVDYLPQELEDFLEGLYEEYGIAASLQILPRRSREEGSPYRGQRLVCAAPTLILDFSGESHVLTADVAAGSIWVDMDSMEEKRRRIEERNLDIRYLSMRKEWKQAWAAEHYKGKSRRAADNH